MANENNIDGIISTDNTQITANGLSIPPSFNAQRSPKLSTLFQRNSNILYTKYSYYNTEEGNGSTSQQPFFAVNPNNLQLGALKSNSSLNSRKKTDSRTFPFISSDEDVIRIRKFLGTSAGSKFNTTQFLLQGLQPFNETKIYNPLMPIIASARPGTLGLISRPNRFIELNASGIFGALGLKAVSTILFGNSVPTPPPGTATGQPATFFNSINPFSSRLPGALPINRQDGGKGLTRGKSASDAYKNFTDYWSPTSRGIVGKFLSAVGNYIRGSTAVGALVPIGQPKGTRFKGDENSYALMVLNGTITKKYSPPGIFGRILQSFVGSAPAIPRFVWVDVNGNEQYGVLQKWNASVENQTQIRLGSATGNAVESKFTVTSKVTAGRYFTTVKSQTAGPQSYTIKGNEKVGVIYGTAVSDEQSEILANYDDYINNIKGNGISGKGTYPTKLDNDSNPSVTTIRFQAGKKSISDGFGFVVGETTNNWDKLKAQKSTKSKSTENILTSSEYDDSTYIKRFRNNSLKKQLLDSTGAKGLTTQGGDSLNKLTVLNKNEIDVIKDRDLIRFWFYDIANEKYIPFRATVKSINERYTSDWDNFQYVGNADKVYNYRGFTRSLGFSFTVVAMSVKELLPMWTRINYLLGLSKPAKYYNGEFIVPPLVKLTIGEMYKEQPMIITNMSISIPDNATWETLQSDVNYSAGYAYYNGLLKSDSRVAQFPMEADITLDINILEKEKPKVGRNNFDDAKSTLFGARLSVVESEEELNNKRSVEQEFLKKQQKDIENKIDLGKFDKTDRQIIREAGQLDRFEQRRAELENIA